ncbi:hypothetical protein QQ045_003483 [Rhodiola kirilowii]
MAPLNNYDQAAINHFAHGHPMHLSHSHHPQTPCAAFTYPTSVPAYGCQHCNFYLHISCAKMPQQLKHPTDSKNTRAFVLLPKPVYPDGMFCCDACGHKGSGFSYHCKDRKIDLHILCAALPNVISVPSHPHRLTLAFAPPYQKNQFMCDLCWKPGSMTWLYHCKTCQFDVHLGCAIGAHAQQHRSLIGQPMPYNQAAFGSRAQIVNPMIGGALNGISSAVAQSVVNMVIGGFVGSGSGFGALSLLGL